MHNDIAAGNMASQRVRVGKIRAKPFDPLMAGQVLWQRFVMDHQPQSHLRIRKKVTREQAAKIAGSSCNQNGWHVSPFNAQGKPSYFDVGRSMFDVQRSDET
jgi:hypothetical protein